MPEEQYPRVDATRLEALVTRLFEHAGVPAAKAAFLGHCLVDADLRGVQTHGTRAVKDYLRGIAAGTLNAQATASVIHDADVTAVVDGDRGIGHLAVTFAMDLAIQKAREHGTGTVLVRNNGHCGAMAYYTQRAADAGCIGFAATTGATAMAPWGGLDRRVGLSPISWAAPTGKGFAYNLDMSPSVVAGSKVSMARDRGERIPLDWALDGQGNPTDDPLVAQGEGTLVAIGGPKGAGLGLAAEILCAVLAGGRYGEGQAQSGGGQFVQAMDIARFQPLAEFTARMDRLVDYVKSSRVKPGAPGVFVPGELSTRRKRDCLQHGIPLDRPIRESLATFAAAAGLAYDIELAG